MYKSIANVTMLGEAALRLLGEAALLELGEAALLGYNETHIFLNFFQAYRLWKFTILGNLFYSKMKFTCH